MMYNATTDDRAITVYGKFHAANRGTKEAQI
jgi:hypothetical protein